MTSTFLKPAIFSDTEIGKTLILGKKGRSLLFASPLER